MKKTNFNLKSIVQKSARWLLTLIALLTLGVGQIWGWTATFRCVPALTFSSWTAGNECKVKLTKGDSEGDATYSMSGTGLMYESGGNLYEIYSGTASDLPNDGAKNLHFERWEGSSWKQNAGQYNDWRNCSAWSGSMYYGSWGSYSYKTWDIPANTTIVWDAGNESWTTAQLYIFKDGYDAADDFTRVGSTTQFTKKYTTKWAGYAGLIIRKNNNWDAQTTNIYTDVQSSTTKITLFTYQGNKSDGKLNWQKTTDAKKATSGVKIYFDNTASKWNEIWLRYGTSWFVRRSASAASKVAGTDNLYVITIPNDAYYASYHLANNYGATNYSNITSDYNLSHKIALQSSNISSDITYIPTTGSGTGTAGNPKTWSYSTISGHTRTLTIAAPSNGSISATYTDETGTEQTVTSGSFTVAQTCKVTITATPNTGYALSGLTLGGASITSGAEQIIRADGTIAATFVAETTHNITVSYKYGTRSLHDNNVVAVGVTTPSSISSESVDGFSFSSWSNLTNVTNKSANLTTDPISVVSTGIGSMTCNYTPWTCSMDVNTTSGNTGYSSRVEMSYDATVKAYYKEFTTTAATQYFRFYINGKKYAPSSNTEVVISGTKVAAAKDVTGYASNMPSVYFNDGGVGSKIKVWFDYENKEAWVEEVKYTVTISAGANGTVSPTSVSVGNVVASSTITATASDHYHWSSWDVPSGVTIASGTGTRQITIKATASGKIVTANFAGDQYTITYKDQGNVTYSGNNEASLPKTHTYGTATALINGTKTGYNFGGWYTDETCTTSAGSSISATAKTANFTLYAKWTAVNYTASNNIKNSDGTTAGQYNVTYDATSISYTTAPSKTGYSLVGLYKQAAFTNKIVNNDRSIVSGTTDYTASGKWHYTSAPNLYAKWQADTYSITLHDNNGGSHNGTATATYDSNKLTSITAPTRTGYHLVDGYYKESGKTNKISDLSGNLQASTAYTTSGKLWNSTSGQTLYAKWAANTYTIAFNANDGNYIGTATGTTASIAATYGTSYTLTANGFSREGYTFAGWTKNADGTGTSYTDGQTGVSNLTTTNGATVTLYAKWTGKTYTVSFNAGTHGTCATASKDVTFGSAYGTLPTPTPSAGYVFSGWYTSASGGSQVTAETIVESAVDHTLYAQYAQKTRVYFMNTLNWSDVWVTYDAYWDKDHDPSWGTGNNGKIYHHMTQITGTNIWYDDIPDAVLASWKYFIAFNSQQLGCSVPDECLASNYNNFDKGKAVFRHDFDSYATMFVPQPDASSFNLNWTNYQSCKWVEDKTGDKVTNYRHSSGYWMRYGDTKAGYTIKGSWDSWNNDSYFSAATAGGTRFQVTKTLAANTTYQFLLYKHCTTSNTYNSVFTNIGATMTSSSCTRWEFKTDQAYKSGDEKNAKIQTTVAGEYTFILECDDDGYIRLSVIYPFAVNDYRVLYSWNDGSAHTYESEIIHPAASTNETISVFVHKASNVTSQSLKLQKCTAINGSGVATWEDVTGGDITLPSDKIITENGVYDFIITQPASGNPTGAYYDKYTGNYYIRTDASDGGWDQYKTCADNIMTLSEYSLTQTLSPPYSHYYCRFIGTVNADVSYAVATDYSPNISGTMTGDETIGAANKLLPATANVRFSWNEQTNALRRAYLKNAQGGDNTRFLVLHGKADNYIYNTDGSAIAANAGKSLAKNELLFDDLGNWIYQVELKAVPTAGVSLIAKYNDADRYLIGGASSWMTIMGGTYATSPKYDILAVYDFKTNRLMTVWKPSGDITQPLTNVDVLLIRHAQDPGVSITFGSGGSLTTKKVYGALEFLYNELVGHVAAWTSSSRPLLKFFVSFPFDVNVSDIFGLNSAYGDAYVIEEYDGAERASKGFFQGDGTTTFWKELKAGDVMKANVGYSVIMDNDYLNNDMGHVWDNKSEGSKVYLYFPSVGDVGSIIASKPVTITVPEHKCEIDRTFTSEQAGGRELNHKNTDSNWNMMGVPIFDNHSDNGTTGQPGAVFADSGNPWDTGMNYFYEWNPSDNQYAIHTAKNYQFKSMHGYMVQYHGDVTFKTAATPATVAARRAQDMKEYQLELQVLDSDAEVLNRTYVELREKACDTFALNEDVYMTYNNYAVNVYTLAGNYDVAANVLSVDNHVIPVGVEVNKAGTYTFSMPSNFSGKVTLIDNFTGEHTDLSISDYEVELPKSVIEDRFLLELDIEKVTTAIDGANDGATLKDGKAHKFLQNGIMYILQNGILYDAQGKRVQ